MTEENLIFLISQPRSGSTLLQRILGNHPEIYTRSEPWIMLHSGFSLKQDNMQASYNIDTWKHAFNDFITNLPKDGKGVYIKELRQMHLNLYEKYTTEYNKKFFLDKTPRYYQVIDELQEIFPHAKTILLIRNPLSVLSSILSTWVKDNYSKLYKYKEDLIDTIDIYTKNILNPSSNILIIKYEDLLLNPHIQIEKICAYLELDFNPKILNFKENNISHWIYGDPVNAKEKNKIDYTHIDKWINNIKNPQIWRFIYDYLQIIGKLRFTQLGYDFESIQTHLEEKLPCESLEVLFNKTKSLDDCMRNAFHSSSYQFSQKYNILFKKIEELKTKNKKYVLYGYGTIGRTIQALMPERIIGYVDINDAKNHPTNLKNIQYDKIIISVLGRENQIIRYLTSELKISKKDILILNIEKDL